jgi:hypothetical protein
MIKRVKQSPKRTELFGVQFRAHCDKCDNTGVHTYSTVQSLIEEMTRQNAFTGNWKFQASTKTKYPKANCPTCIRKQTNKEKTK